MSLTTTRSRTSTRTRNSYITDHQFILAAEQFVKDRRLAPTLTVYQEEKALGHANVSVTETYLLSLGLVEG